MTQEAATDFTVTMEVNFVHPTPKKIFYDESSKVVVVLWSDGTRTKSTCAQDDNFDLEIGFAICLAKRMVHKKRYQKMLKKAQKQVSGKETQNKVNNVQNCGLFHGFDEDDGNKLPF